MNQEYRDGVKVGLRETKWTIGRLMRWGIPIFIGLFFVGKAFGIVGFFVNDAVKVGKEQFSPTAMLRKYEDFKEMYASLESKKANISAMQAKVRNLESMYKGQRRNEWERRDISTHNKWMGEQDVMKLSFNRLASTYNANMAKFNYSFANAGTLPKGALEPLPREVAIYITE